MALIEINWHPDRKELRRFGTVAAVASLALALLLCSVKGLDIAWGLLICGIGLLVRFCSVVSAPATRVIYLGLVLATWPIGYVLSTVVLAVFYFLVLTPVGLIFRLIGRDVLGRRFDETARSYWRKRQPPETTDRYFHQF